MPVCTQSASARQCIVRQLVHYNMVRLTRQCVDRHPGVAVSHRESLGHFRDPSPIHLKIDSSTLGRVLRLPTSHGPT